ncbi:hypothetical protein MD484_g550, partial [Candolleomyces efflorescens]
MTHPHPTPVTIPNPATLMVTQNTLREAFLSLDAASISNMIQSFVAAHPSLTPLTPVVEALFEASVAESAAYTRDPHNLQQQQQQQHPSSASSTPIPPGGGGNAPGTSSVATNSLSEDMQRIANERQRRKDHIQWARIHAASLELGLMNNLGRATEGDGYSTSTGRAFSEMVARDAVWESDEAEWVAGIFVLRAVIRTASRGDRRQREEYNEMLMQYESRWKEIKDEMRQTMVTEVLLSSREELARLEEPMT